MPQILVWKCSHTGALFENKTKYQTHLKKLSVERVAKRKAAAFKKERVDFFTQMRETVRTIDEFKDFVFANWDKFHENAVLKNAWRLTDKQKKLPRPTLTNMSLEVQWSNNVSNSHSCPFNGETNWGGRKKDVPRGYPGWTGHIRYRISEYQSIHGSDMWEGTGLHIGTGGGGNEYYYGVELFADDWPAMVEARDKAKVWKALHNDPRSLEVIVQEMCNA